MKSHPRFNWAAKILDVKSSDYILEIGCGVGFAVEEIVPHLSTGKITAIDRSPTMIAKAIHRNQNNIQTGKAEFLKTDLLGFSDRVIKFNKIFCFNINLFWTNKSIGEESAVLKTHLSPNGQLYILYGPMMASGFEKISKPLTQNLEKEKFRIIRVEHDKKLNCCCFVSRRD